MAREQSSKPPWKRKNPNREAGTSRPLTAEQKHQARTRARAAGRPYPNLVDNMAVARTRSAKTSVKRSTKKR